MDEALLDEVHAFWFGPLDDVQALPHAKIPMWFGATPEIDSDIGARFGTVIDPAAAHPWAFSALPPRRQVGLIVLLDQLTRNTRRGSALTHQHDALARDFARAAVAGGLERFALIERMFAILPLGHSEALPDQDTALALFERSILPFVPAGDRFWGHALHQARHHRDTIARFGRFPHRNSVLGRETTTEEAAFLAAKPAG